LPSRAEIQFRRCGLARLIAEETVGEPGPSLDAHVRERRAARNQRARGRLGCSFELFARRLPRRNRGLRSRSGDCYLHSAIVHRFSADAAGSAQSDGLLGAAVSIKAMFSFVLRLERKSKIVLTRDVLSKEGLGST
jgi:hypothetical protein